VGVICKTADPVSETASENQPLLDEDPQILCRACSNAVTHPGFKILRDNRFSHTFANPYGHVFEIGCFSRAQGCVKASAESDEFPWFKGYRWSVGACRRCRTQLGWVFSSGRDTFYGLILDTLVFPEPI
jgi:hypothetical protein